eukprot:gene11508-15414_t
MRTAVISNNNGNSNNGSHSIRGSFSSDALEGSYQKWIKNQMEKRVAEYSDIHELILFCATWNVNAKMLPETTDDLKDWLIQSTQPVADVYIIGFQEIVDLNVMNVMINSGSSDESSVYWIKKCFETLSMLPYSYKLVEEQHMVGLQIVVFAKEELMPFITDIRSTSLASGVLGVMGNKGGVSIRMDIHDSPICFVCSHFHADRKNVTIRNNDYQTIIENTLFAPNSVDSNGSNSNNKIEVIHSFNQSTPQPGYYTNANKDIPLKILNHEHIIWIGDLNYRIETDIEISEIFTKLSNGDWQSLIDEDQLINEMIKKNVFMNFIEGKLIFPPTYKYQVGTDVYEARPDKKIRAPAWCDRILCRTATKDSIQQLDYNRVSSLCASDHKPVYSVFNCQVRKFVPEKVKDIYQDLLFSVDKWVNASTPKLNVEGRLIELGLVLCKHKYRASIKLTNVGTVMAEWAFVPKHSELLICKTWMKWNQVDGILAPNESCEVEVVVELNVEAAVQVLSTGATTLEDIIILRVHKGSDFFCMVSGTIDAKNVEETFQSQQREKLSNFPPLQPQHISRPLNEIVDQVKHNNVGESTMHLSAIGLNTGNNDNDVSMDDIYGMDDNFGSSTNLNN